MTMIPLYDRVIIRREEQERTSKGGIVLTNSAISDTFQGEVIAIGEGRVTDRGERITPQLQLGDVVLFAQMVEHSEMDGDAELLIMREDNVLAIVSRKDVKETNEE